MSARRTFELSTNIDHYLAILSKLYGRENERQKQEIIVNAQIRVHDEWHCDNWNNGTYGHALYLTVPEALYFEIANDREYLQQSICNDINKVHNIQNEHIAEVFIEMEVSQDKDWRKESGVLAQRQRIVPVDAEYRIWGDSGYRVFLSHKTEVKQQTANSKTEA